MTTYVICRDYRDGESFPYLTANPSAEEREQGCMYHACDETRYECWTPDEIEDDEFNMVILLGRLPVLVRSMHFDFEEE
jgi:hypothetical protein